MGGNAVSDWRTRLREVIEQRGMSLPELAAEAKYDYVTLWKALIKEKHTMKRQSMNRICQVLKVDPDYIWNGTAGIAEVNSMVLLKENQVVPWLEGYLDRTSLDQICMPFKMNSHKAFAVISQAMDMVSIIPIDAYVYFNPDLQPQVNDVVIALYRNTLVIRRYAKVAEDEYLVAEEKGFHANSLGSGDKVLGVAISFYHVFPAKENRALKNDIYHYPEDTKNRGLLTQSIEEHSAGLSIEEAKGLGLLNDGTGLLKSEKDKS